MFSNDLNNIFSSCMEALPTMGVIPSLKIEEVEGATRQMNSR